MTGLYFRKMCFQSSDRTELSLNVSRHLFDKLLTGYKLSKNDISDILIFGKLTINCCETEKLIRSPFQRWFKKPPFMHQKIGLFRLSTKINQRPLNNRIEIKF